MREEEKIRAKLARLFGLPEDVLLNLPLISLIGNLNLLVENHRGIIKYTPEVVKIRIKRGKMVVKGRELRIDKMKKEKVKIMGKISELSFDVS